MSSSLGYQGPWDNLGYACSGETMVLSLRMSWFLSRDTIVLGLRSGSHLNSVWSAWVLADGAKTLVLEPACASLEEGGERMLESGASSGWLHAKTVTDFCSENIHLLEIGYTN